MTAPVFDDRSHSESSGPTPASLIRRALAWIIDAFIVLILGVAATPAFGVADMGDPGPIVIGGLALGAWGVWYFFAKDGGRGGAGVGKRGMRLAVIHLPTGAPCSRSRSALRTLVRLLLGFVPIVEGIAALMSPQRLSICDRIASTQVVSAEALGAIAPESRWRRVARIAVMLGAFFYYFVMVPTERMLEDARMMQAKFELETLQDCLDIYKMNFGRYPPGECAPDGSVPSADLLPGCSLRRVDPWGRPYVYNCPGVTPPHECDFMSFGADGVPGGEGENADVLPKEHPGGDEGEKGVGFQRSPSHAAEDRRSTWPTRSWSAPLQRSSDLADGGRRRSDRVSRLTGSG